METWGKIVAALAALVVGFGGIELFIAWQEPPYPVTPQALAALVVGPILWLCALLMIIAGRLGRLVEVQEAVARLLSGHP